MPEVVTKHPDVVMQVLTSAGARCGAGEPQKILTRCPRERFCALPGGEVCVYGVDGIPDMTQLSRAELCAQRGGVPAAGEGSSLLASTGPAALLPAVLVGFVALRMLRRRVR